MSRTRFAKDDKSYDAALDRALTLLEYRARSAQEMRRALMQREFPEDVADEVVARLRELGYIDDAAYARALVSSTIQKGSGSRRARYALMQRGVPDDVSAEALEEVDEEAEFSAALARGEKLWARYGDLPAREKKMKVSRSLAGRGFSYDVISSVLRRVSNGADEEDD